MPNVLWSVIGSCPGGKLDEALRAETFIAAGIFVRTKDGKLAVAKRYANVFVPNQADGIAPH